MKVCAKALHNGIDLTEKRLTPQLGFVRPRKPLSASYASPHQGLIVPRG
jgi:hypothetical protein